jgi:hypothetical protein
MTTVLSLLMYKQFVLLYYDTVETNRGNIVITIDDKTYVKEDLSPEQIAYAERVQVIDKNVKQLEMQINELNVLVSAYAKAIKESFTEEE